ncbi:IclR family transcriptional regulator [Paralcaligenes sp. KSB-10]|uniref:IclR family transcriptional regulator n=1 Tax=Paralcaligenes sp. KSB-10 TaxID=2901142 RepID=UPI001E497726|nr:IclR family transcriptional regulator [Paralcaligenes sp. KSB-10]UHL63774.1 IclR family transcriptional regulator [Paralcaligenes sp. KSB-10]
MSSLERMLSLLDVFTPAAPVWSAEDLIRYSGSPPSTCYRYLKVLCGAGFLARVANGSYVLGPRILELDRTIRLCDPVYVAGTSIAQHLTDAKGYSTLLCILFSDSVMCVQQALSREAPPQLFNRGQRRPLIAGASAKAILAHLPMHQLRSIYAKNRKEIASSGLGADWEFFKKALKQIRSDGYCMTVGEYNPGVMSIATPLFNQEGEVLGSLAMVAWAENSDMADFRTLMPDVVRAGQEISARIAAMENMMDLPARAIG